MSGAIEKRAKWVLWGSILFSMLLHVAASAGLSLLPSTSVALAAIQRERIEFEMEEADEALANAEAEAAEPEVVPEPEAPAPPEPEPEVAPPVQREPRPRDEPEPPAAAPLAEQVHDFGGEVLGTVGPGASWSTAQANGQDVRGPIGNPVARTTGRDVAGRTDGEVGGTGTAPAAAPRVSYSRPPRQPAGMAGHLERFYPTGAYARGVEGRARVMVRVLADGSVEAQRVVTETPAGEGFGRACMAAVNASPRWSPALDEDGEAVTSRPAPFDCRWRQR
ncbi:MAG: TonB family protein [Myxococcales bacterium]|nr:TonB family protein [Myxococcales bacterium]